MKRFMIAAAIAIASISAHAQVTYQTSFDCSKASSYPEREICSDKALAAEDLSYSKEFQAARDASADKQAFRNHAITEFKYRQQCEDRECIMNWYKGQEQNLVSLSAPDAVSSPDVSAPVTKNAGRFAVQLGAFSSRSDALGWAATLATIGVPAYTEQRSGKTLLRAGPFSSHDEADAVIAKITNAGLLSAASTTVQPAKPMQVAQSAPPDNASAIGSRSDACTAKGVESFIAATAASNGVPLETYLQQHGDANLETTRDAYGLVRQMGMSPRDVGDDIAFVCAHPRTRN